MLPTLGRVTRLNPNGTVDTSFGSNGYFSDPPIVGPYAIAVQPDDKILIESNSYVSGGYQRHSWSNGCCPAARLTLRSARGGKRRFSATAGIRRHHGGARRQDHRDFCD